MAGTKGKGTLAYFDVDNDDEYRKLGCLVNVTPSSLERAKQEDEVCLDDDAAIDDTGDLKYTDLEGSILFENSAEEVEARAAIIADTEFNACVKFPLATAVYSYFKIKLTKWGTPQVTRDDKIKVDFTALVRTEPTYVATAPTL